MVLAQINPELLNKWKKKGELIVIWRCERCCKKIPFYKSNMSLINMITLAWTHNHKYCPKCKKKIKGIPNKKKVQIPRINRLLEIYESELKEIYV